MVEEVQSNTNTPIQNMYSDASKEIRQYAAFFDLLDQIDRRLMKEDANYKKKYMKGKHDKCSKKPTS